MSDQFAMPNGTPRPLDFIGRLPSDYIQTPRCGYGRLYSKMRCLNTKSMYLSRFVRINGSKNRPSNITIRYLNLHTSPPLLRHIADLLGVGSRWHHPWLRPSSLRPPSSIDSRIHSSRLFASYGALLLPPATRLTLTLLQWRYI